MQNGPPNKDCNALSHCPLVRSSLFRLFLFFGPHFAVCASLCQVTIDSLLSLCTQSASKSRPKLKVDPCPVLFSQDAFAQPARAAPCHCAVCSLQSFRMPSSGRRSTRPSAGQIPRPQAEGELLDRAHRWRQPDDSRTGKHHHGRADGNVVADSNA